MLTTFQLEDNSNGGSNLHLCFAIFLIYLTNCFFVVSTPTVLKLYVTSASIQLVSWFAEEGEVSPQTTVFTVLIYPVLSNQMLRAATAVLNKLVPKELLPILTISKNSLSLFGCMHLESPSSRLPFGLNVPQLRTESFPQSKKCVIVVIVMQGRN